MKTLTQNISLVLTAKTIKGTSFVGIRNYENKQLEISNQTILVGITYENCLVHDFNALKESKETVFAELSKKYPIALIELAFAKVYDSLEKRLSSEDVKEKLRLENDTTIARSDAQINAYTRISKGIKIHKESDKLHVFGLVIKKTVIKAIEYKKVNSSDLTIAQNIIKKLCNFKQNKYHTFIFDKAEVKIQGFAF
jgi:hypothetical protein